MVPVKARLILVVEAVEKVRNGDEMSGNFAQGSVNYSYSREVIRGTDGEI